MGDRSPKAIRKQASQKKPKVNSADQKRQQDLAAKALLAQGKNKRFGELPDARHISLATLRAGE
jgi:hypothetical protein